MGKTPTINIFLTFFNWISNTYGNEACKTLKDIAHLNEKLAIVKNRRIFLLKCRQHDIIPKCLQTTWNHIEVKHNKEKMSRWKLKIENELLNMMISETNQELNDITNRMKFLRTKASRYIPVHVMDNFDSSQASKYEKTFNESKNRQTRKFDNLLSDKLETIKRMTKPQWISNISNTTIPDYVTTVLGLGPKFGLPYEHKKMPIIKTLSGIESYLYNNPSADEIRAKVINITTNFLNNYKRSKNSDKFILQLVNKTKKFLADNQQIIVIKADKGNKTIIMNRSEYEESMDKLLNDQSTYKKTSRDPTLRIQKTGNDLIKLWRLQNRINDEQEKHLQTHNSVAPACYGLGKLHKKVSGEIIPLRPVVATIQSPLYKLSQLIAKCLSKVVSESPYYLKDSWQFAKCVKGLKIPAGYKLISLDATSLFTNVPLDLSLQAIEKRWPKIQQHTFLTKNQFLEAVKTIVSESYFRYGDHYYLQIDGLAMGNSISGFLAHIVMEDLELKAFNKIPFLLPFYKRFVDDILTAIPKNQSETILKIFNSHHQRLKFTIEEEKNNAINFLDLTLTRNTNGEITTKWYQKEVASGRCLNFMAHNPMTHKRNVASTMIDRAITFTNPKDRPTSLKKVSEILTNNGYPQQFINRMMKERVDRLYNEKPKVVEKEEKKPISISVPYIPGLTERLNKTMSTHNFTLACKTSNNIGTIYTRTKYTIPKNKKSKVIYEVSCKDCHIKYVGSTKQWLVNRMRKHRSDVHLKKRSETTGLTIHSVENHHTFDFDKIKIMEQVPNYYQRQIAEKMFICKTPNNCNQTIDTAGLHSSYVHLLKSNKSIS